MKYGDILELLKTRRFLPLFLCQFLAVFCDNFLRTALSSYITYHATELPESVRNMIITLAIALFMAPYIFFSATAGQIADKYNKAKVIQFIRFSNIFIIGLTVFSFYTKNYTLMLFCIFLAGTEATFFGPLKYSILPDHVEKSELLAANGLVEAGTFMAILLGVIFGGISGYTNPIWLHITIVVLLAISITSYLISTMIPPTEPGSSKLKINWNIYKETLFNIKYCKKDEDTFLAILGISWFWMIGGIFMGQLPGFASYMMHAEQSVLTLLLAIFSLGTGIGSIICNRLLKGQLNLQYVPIANMMMTVFILLLWYTSSLYENHKVSGGIHYFLSDPKGWALCLEILLLAVFGGIYIVPLYVIAQVRSKRSHRSRIIAANNIYNSIFLVGGTGVIMALSYLGADNVTVFLLLGVTNLITAAYICRILPDTVIKSCVQFLFKLFNRVEIVGLENYHKAGDRVLIIANHASLVDPPLLGAFLPDTLVFAIDTQQSRNWWIYPFLSYLRAYPIDPSNPMATKTLIEKLRENNKVVIFPEGRITVTGSLMKIYEGPGLIADKADAYLLPIRIDGARHSVFSYLRGKIKLKLFPKIKITIMPPQKIEVPKEFVGRERRQMIGKKLYDIMSSMMFKESETTTTIFESLIDASKKYGQNKIVVQDVDYNSLSYKKVLLGSFILGRKFAKYSKPREYIGIMLPNAAATVATFFGCLAYGRIPAMLNFSTGVKNIVSSCSAASIKRIYTSKRFIEKGSLHHIVEALSENGVEVKYLEDVRINVTIYDKLRGYLASFFPAWYYNHINRKDLPEPSDPAVALFTSGSEGMPKGVVLSNSNIHANIKQASSRVDFSESDVLFNTLPIFHSFGLTGGFLLPILSGVKTFFYPSPLHYRIIPEMVYGSNATVMFGTDTFLSGYAKHAHPYDFFSVRYIFAGAEKLRDETRKTYMEKFGIRIFEGYGATEASPIISVNTPMHYKLGTVGRMFPEIDYVIEPVPGINEGGKLIIHGPNVMLGYLKTDNPGKLEKPTHRIDGEMRKGWYDTGDIVKVDDDGFITILGRVKRFAKVGGEMVSLSAIEETVNKLWPTFNNAVINMESSNKGEVIVLFTNNPKAAREDVHKFIKANGYIELFVPKVVKYINDIPLLATGKVDYVILKEQAKLLLESDMKQLEKQNEDD